MFCSACGASEQQPNAYCKRCGEWIADPAPPSRLDIIGGKTPEQKLRGLVSNSAVGLLLSTFIAIVILLSLDDIQGRLILFALFAAVMTVVLQAINFAASRKLRNDLQQRRSKSDSINPLAGPYGQALNEGDAGMFSDVQSVTENTTRTLETAPRNPKT